MSSLKAFCKAAGWPRLRRWSQAIERVKQSEREAAAAAPKPAPAPGPALATDPEGEIHLAVTWHREIDDSGGKYPPAESGGGWLYGTSDDPRLAIPLVWTEAKRDSRTGDEYENIYFVAPIAEVEGKMAVVNGVALGHISYSFIPADGCRYDGVPAELKPDGLISMPQTRVPAEWMDQISDALGVWKRDRR